MAILDFFKQKQVPGNVNHVFDNEDRSYSLEIKRQKRELEKIRHEIMIEKEKHNLELARVELERLKQEFSMGSNDDDNDENDPLMNLASMLLPILQQNMQKTPEKTTENAKLELKDEEILEIIKQFPVHQVNMFKRLPNDTQKQFITQYLKDKNLNVSDDTIQRSIVLLNGANVE